MAAAHRKNVEFKNMKNFFVSCLESRIENPTTYYGSFQIGPFQKGQGITLANALRRTILSEIPGIGIMSAKLQTITNGTSSSLNSVETKTLESSTPEKLSNSSKLNVYSYAAHEYAILEGVRESTLDILLNLRKVVLTSNTFFQTTQVAFLEMQGPREIFAGDLRLPSGLQVVDPNQYIATLTTNVTLQAKVFISFGKKDQAFNTPLKAEPGVLNLEPTFFPIKKVNYKIEFDQIHPEQELIIFEIWTNGSLHPRKALEKGIVTLIQIFSKIQKNLNIFESFLPSIVDDSSVFELNKKTKNTDELVNASNQFNFNNISLEGDSNNNLTGNSLTPSTKINDLNSQTGEPTNPDQAHPSINFLKDTDKNAYKNIFVDNFFLLPIRKRLARLDIGNLNLSLSLYTYLKRLKIDSVQDLLVNYKNIQKQLRITNPSLVKELEMILKPVGLNINSNL